MTLDHITPILNTDEMRHFVYDLPPEACTIEVTEPWVFYVNLTYHQYYLGPDTDPMLGQDYYERSISPLERKPVEYCHSCPGNYPHEDSTIEDLDQDKLDTVGQSFPASRHADPVVLKGVDVPELFWHMPNDIVGFRYMTDADEWQQIPIQIDEKHYQDWHNIKNQIDCLLLGRYEFAELWADTSTYSGPDENPVIDYNDELVFMARHLGDMKPNGFPAPEGTTEVAIFIHFNSFRY